MQTSRSPNRGSVQGTSLDQSVTPVQDAFDGALSSLVSSITFGDLSSAQGYLNRVEQLLPGSYAASNGSLVNFLSNVSAALSNDDIVEAQRALQTWRGSAQQGGAGGNTTQSSPRGSSIDPGFSAVGNNVLTLFGAIDSGDLSTAQSAYESLTGLLGEKEEAPPLVTSSSYASFTGDGSIKDSLPKIGSALDSNDVELVRNAFGSFLQTLSSGSLLKTTA